MESEQNLLKYNHISNNTGFLGGGDFPASSGILLLDSNYNIIFENSVYNNGIGIYLGDGSAYNKLYHNNLINNSYENEIYNAYDEGCGFGDCNNSWHSGYPSGGNYWSDYLGADNFSGPNQTRHGSDGIGDTPYNISGSAGAQDHYPFMQENGWIGEEKKPPFASFTYSPENPVVNQTITFNASLSYDIDGNITLYKWDFGDNTTKQGVIVNHSYLKEGNYTITLTVTDDKGATNSITDLLNIKAVKGDFNGNGRVDIGDATYVAYMVVGKVPVYLSADFNGNGKVDIGDASKIAYYVVGKISEL